MRHYLNQEQCEKAVGGPAELRKLLPLAGSPLPDPAWVEACQGRADGEIRSMIHLSFDLDSFDALWFNMPIGNVPAPTRPMSDEDKATIISAGKDIFAYYAWKDGSKAQAMPETVATDRLLARETLKNMGQRLQTLGSEPATSTSRKYSWAAPRGVGHYNRQSPMARFRGMR